MEKEELGTILKEEKKNDEEVKELKITADHLKIIFHNQWLHTVMLFGMLGIAGWTLIVNVIELVLFQIIAVLLMLLFLGISYWKTYKSVSPEYYFEDDT